MSFILSTAHHWNAWNDEYAAKFRVGEIVKFRGLQRKGGEDVPIGAYSVGTFTARVNPHRPLVSKDFSAFQSTSNRQQWFAVSKTRQSPFLFVISHKFEFSG
eukprot:scaffold8807_cov149-Ochromonas_danica.AAC.2